MIDIKLGELKDYLYVQSNYQINQSVSFDNNILVLRQNQRIFYQLTLEDQTYMLYETQNEIDFNLLFQGDQTKEYSKFDFDGVFLNYDSVLQNVDQIQIFYLEQIEYQDLKLYDKQVINYIKFQENVQLKDFKFFFLIFDPENEQKKKNFDLKEFCDYFILGRKIALTRIKTDQYEEIFQEKFDEFQGNYEQFFYWFLDYKQVEQIKLQKISYIEKINQFYINYFENKVQIPEILNLRVRNFEQDGVEFIFARTNESSFKYQNVYQQLNFSFPFQDDLEFQLINYENDENFLQVNFQIQLELYEVKKLEIN